MAKTNNLMISPEVKTIQESYQLPLVDTFGTIIGPFMASCLVHDSKWGAVNIEPYQPILIHPHSMVLHYGQAIFEGMKAYKVNSAEALLFRPEENYKRFNISAKRLAMPEVPKETFFSALEAMVACTEKFIPNKSGQSLYIRPFMFAFEPGLGVRPARTFKFMITSSPSSAYFSGEINVLIERKICRAFPGGTGGVKVGGNYAATLQKQIEAKQAGYQLILWLDAHEKKYVEEFSAMNFFAVINNTLYTTPESDTVLPGITRKSIVELAPDLNIPVEVKPLAIDDILKQIENGHCSEIFACGTAAIISSIDSLADSNKNVYKLPKERPIADQLRKSLLDIQEGRSQSKSSWIKKVPPITL